VIKNDPEGDLSVIKKRKGGEEKKGAKVLTYELQIDIKLN